MSSMACETSHLTIPFPNTYSQVQQNGDDAGHLSSQMLQHLSCLPYLFSESSLSNLLDGSVIDNDKVPMDQSSIRFPTNYDSSSSSGSSTPSDDSHIVISRSRRVRGLNAPTTASVSHLSSPTPSSIRFRDNSCVPSRAGTIKGCQRTPELSDISDADTARPLQGLKQPSNSTGDVKPGSLGVHPRQFCSEMRATSLPHIDSQARTQSGNLSVSPQTRSIRKKSGELIKPSLKRPKLPTLSIPTGGGVVQSEPTTPTLSKAVHFDAKLEHVKLFLAKQKPLAVSRDHDMTTDTSGTESDFPSFARGPLDDCSEKQIELQVRNMRSIPSEGVDVVLQDLTLSQSDKTVVGRVRVRNIAFEKWVAARFTLDLWQTTSEVTAHYTASLDGDSFDIFTFSIRLHDMWARIEEKTMFIALRYSVAGRQFWDNNNGANYMIKFVQKPPARRVSTAIELIIEDLSAKVESASVDTDPLQVSPSPRLLVSAGGSVPPDTQTSTYTLEPSNVRSKHAPHFIEKIPPRHTRAVTIGSSRELEKPAQMHITRSGSIESESPLLTSQPRAGRERNHRRAYFDRPMGGMPRKTPPSPALLSLPEERSPTRGNDPVKGTSSLFERFTAQTMARVSSDSSVPSAMLNFSSPLTSPGPSTPDADSKPSPHESYSKFLNQFCFFTGSNSLIDHSPGPIIRSQSASNVEAFLHSHPPSRHFPSRDTTFNGYRSSSLRHISASHTQHASAMLESAA